MRHFSWKTGQPCSCTFGPVIKMAKVSSKLDWLRSRPDLQTPEGQEWLTSLERTHPHADPLFPWLTREMKKGRIDFRSGLPRFETPPDEGGNTYVRNLDPSITRHWMDWFNSNHPTRRGVDINSKQFQVPQMLEHVNAWDQSMREEAERAALQQQDDAEVMHQWPDGWSVRKLGPEHLKYEGDKMGHCVGGYGYEDAVRRGDTHIYSLRDPKGEPHATMELQPNNPIHGYGPWNGPNKGKIVQIQGKGNEVPNPEYQARLKDWFQTYPEDQRPNWDYDRDHIDHIGGIVPNAETYDPSYDAVDVGEPDDGDYDQGGYGPHGDYGLVAPQRSIDYGDVVNSLIRPRNYNDWKDESRQRHSAHEVKALYKEALRRGEIPQLGEAVGTYANWANDDYNRLEDQNVDYLGHYPGDEWDEDPEELEHQYNREYGREAGETPEEKAATLQDYWQEKRDQYDWAQNELYESHAPSHLTSELYGYLNPHYDNATGRFENQPQQPTFSKLARKRPRKPHRGAHGKACYCPFGISGKFARRVQASKLDWLRERPDMQDEEGQQLLRVLERMYSQHLHTEKDRRAADKVFPWMVREFRKGRLAYPHGVDPKEAISLTLSPYGGAIDAYRAVQIGQYLDAKKKEGQGVDLMQQQANELLPEVNTWSALQQELNEAEDWRKDMGEIVHQWPDGWTIRQLRDSSEAEQEGSDMGNCVGTEQYGYPAAIDSGNLHVYSLRSPANKPHATVAINPDGSIEEIEDRSGKFGGKYAGRLQEWMDQAGDLSYEGNGRHNKWWDDYYHMEGPQNFRELVGHNNDNDYANIGLPGYPDDDWYQNEPDEYRNACADADEMGLEEPDLRVDDPNYENILQSLHWRDASSHYQHNNETGRGEYIRHPAGPIPYNPEHGQYVLNHAASNGHIDDLKYALEQYDDSDNRYQPDPNITDPREQQDAERAHYRGVNADPEVQMVNHLMPQVNPSWEPYRASPMELHPEQQQMFQEQLRWPNFGDQSQQLQMMYQYPGQSTYSKIAHPLYYRFVFSPMSGEVDLSHNGEPEPKLHGEMAAERNEPGLVHGYAYRIGGGWRLFDWESRPLEDPYVSAQVMRKLRSGSQGPSQDDWEALPQTFSRFHHGMPIVS